MKKNHKISLKIGDSVTIISGSHKTKNGEIIFIDKKEGKVIVKGVNIISKSIRPNALNPVGKIIRIENSIHVSNVKLTKNKMS
jgi:large subunit ribosomal protein L24